MQMGTRNICTAEGKTAFYEEGGKIYSRSGKNSYRVKNGWWYRLSDGHAAFYVKDNWIYTTAHAPTYYYEIDFDSR